MQQISIPKSDFHNPLQHFSRTIESIQPSYLPFDPNFESAGSALSTNAFEMGTKKYTPRSQKAPWGVALNVY
jgi:hypothetical protein